MDETATATVPLAGEVLAAYDRFVAQGGDAATFFKANPEVIPPAEPPKPRPAVHPADAAVLGWARVAWNYSAAKAIASLRKSQRGRQGR